MYSIPDNVTWKNLKDSVVLLNLESGEYYTLNDTASSIWKALVQNGTNEFILEQLCAEYDVDQNELSKDIESSLNFLKEEKLIEGNEII